MKLALFKVSATIRGSPPSHLDLRQSHRIIRNIEKHSLRVIRPTAVERAGLTEVLVTGIEMRWISVNARPMATAAALLRILGYG